MSTTRYATLLGLALGAIWALSSFGYALLAGALAAVGYVVALVLEGRLHVDDLGLGGASKDRSNTL